MGRGEASAMGHFIVDRSKWLRGEGRASLLLRSSDGKRCCLGFVGSQCGFADHELAERGSPESVLGRSGALFPVWVLGWGGEFAMRVNDSRELADTEREAKLKGIFATHGHTIEFVDGAE